MKLLSLNIRGFGGTSKKLSLKRLVKRTDPDIVFLQETMVDGNIVREALNNILKYWSICTIDSKGLSGGLWNPFKACFNAYQSLAGIVLEGKIQGCSYDFNFINCYGPYSHIKEFWQLGFKKMAFYLIFLSFLEGI
jgi:exonuclease III